MEKFVNETTEGNELAIRRGVRVPDGDINLAWAKVPALSPEDNVMVLDTSRTIAENAFRSTAQCKLYYANSLGILEDEFGNQVVEDEYPGVSDVFLQDEDYLTVPSSEYSASDILPHVHVSRYFHVDYSSLSIGDALSTYASKHIRVIDNLGRDYTRTDGTKRYRIKIVPAFTTLSGDDDVSPDRSGAYRVYAFVDGAAVRNEELYLAYNKVEVDTEGKLKNQDINHRELLNPQPYFEYVPEETDVADPANRDKRIYTTKPISNKDQILDVPHAGVDGFRVYVPRKAIADPRQFQLFRWRVGCEFVKSYKIDPIKDPVSTIRCGVVVTNNNPDTASPYIFYNLENSEFNATEAIYINPLSEFNTDPEDSQDLPSKEQKAYWTVNFDTVTHEQLKQFDFLVWSPGSAAFNFNPYWSKIEYFTKTLGRTIFFDTDNFTVPTGLGVNTTSGVWPRTGKPRVSGGSRDAAVGTFSTPFDRADILFDADEQLGGWDFNDGLGKNLLENTSFEAITLEGDSDTITGWLKKDPDGVLVSKRRPSGTADSNDPPAVHGGYTLRLTNNGDADDHCYMYKTFTDFTPGTQYVISAYGFIDEFEGPAFDWRMLVVIGNRSDGTKHVYGKTIAGASRPRNRWIRHFFTFTPSKVNRDDSLEIRLYCPRGRTYWDAVQLEELDVDNFVAEPPSITIEESFEEDTVFERGDGTADSIEALDDQRWLLRDVDQKVTASISEDRSNHGTKSLRMDSSVGGVHQHLYTTLSDLEAGAYYTISAWSFIESFREGAFDDRGMTIATPNAKGIHVTTKLNSKTPRRRWVRHAVTLFVKEGAHATRRNPTPNFRPGITVVPKDVVIRLHCPKGAVHWDTVTIRKTKLRLQDPLPTAYNENTTSTDEYNTLTPFNSGLYGDGYVQYMLEPTAYDETLVQALRRDGSEYAPIVARETFENGGAIIVSTTSIAPTCSRLFSHVTGALLFHNNDASIRDDDNYLNYINAHSIEGAMKFMFNVSLFSTRNAVIDSTDEETYSTSWKFFSKWFASWVINADNGVLSDEEKQENDFVFLPRDLDQAEPIWQRKLSNKTLRELVDNNLTDADINRIEGATRNYVIEVTNSNVQTPDSLSDISYPYAWTEAYTPAFTVPADMGPHVIREESTLGDYHNAQYLHKEYPPKPYALQVAFASKDTEEHHTRQTVNWSATGTGLRNVTTWRESTLRWSTHGDPNEHFYQVVVPPYVNSRWPNSWLTYQYANYYNDNMGQANWNWPSFGIWSRLNLGSRGAPVAFVQDALNKFARYGYFQPSTGTLSEDGYYGPATRQAVIDFQSQKGARFVDGIVDGETYSMIGARIIGLKNLEQETGTNLIPNSGYYNDVLTNMRIENLDNNQHVFWKRSNIQGGPPKIWDAIALRFFDEWQIFAVTIEPYIPGNAKTMQWEFIDLRKSEFASNYNLYDMFDEFRPSQARFKTNTRVVHGRERRIEFAPVPNKDTVIVGISQNQASGYGSSRAMGLRQMYAHGRKLVSTTVRTAITASGRVVVGNDGPVIVRPVPDDMGNARWSDLQWTDIELDNDLVSATIQPNGAIRFVNNIFDLQEDTNFTLGDSLPQGSSAYYAMNEHGRFHPGPESGWITKTDGVKLLCDADKRPVGFPDLPSDIGPYEHQKHYAMLYISRMGTDPSVHIGFYDFKEKEFIVNEAGEAQMSYIEYLQRGPDNVFIGVISEFELNIQKSMPATDDAPKLPIRWAMPIYGVCSQKSSHISIDRLPPKLGPADHWPVPIKTGDFNRAVTIRPRAQGGVTGWLSNYQGSTLNAHYSVPEAAFSNAWSEIYGRPNVDIVNEHPYIVDDNAIQVHQPPILLHSIPTANPTLADPVRPVISVYTKTAPTAEWESVPLTEIEDYNASEGIIYFREPLITTDENLIKIDYTSARDVYYMRHQNGTVIDLNPYPNHDRTLLNKPIYIYIVPEYVRDLNGDVIPDSLVDSTLRFTVAPTVFDPLAHDYDPLAVQLGTIQVSTSLDLHDLLLLDTRKRGGGAKEGFSLAQLERLLQESMYYWDVNHGTGMSYQAGGYIVIRLPEILRNTFERDEIDEVIKKNITAGTVYKLETLDGVDWGGSLQSGFDVGFDEGFG